MSGRVAIKLTVPLLIVAWGAACDQLKPVDVQQYGNDTAPGNNPDEETAAETEQPGGPGGPGGGPGGGPQNAAPRADAGDDQVGKEIGDVVFLDGTGSSDLDGDALSFLWSFDYRPGGSTAAISNPTFATAQVMLDRPGDFLLKLTVTDARGMSDDDIVKISVVAPNSGPVADAGIDQRVSIGQLVQLSGVNSTDPDGDPLAYVWRMVQQPPGSVTLLSGERTSSPRFTADATGVYTVELIVSDGNADSPPDLVSITADDPQTQGGGGSNSGDCLSCSAEDAAQRFATGDAANGFIIGALPMLALLLERRRRTAAAKR